MVVAISLFSCSDFLDVEPELQISFREQLSTVQGVQEIVSGIYRETEALASSKFTTYPDYIAGNIAFTPLITSKVVRLPFQIENSYNFQDVAIDSDYDSFYDNSYATINEANLLLESLDGIAFFTEIQKNQLRAELLTIRAFVHYNLTLLYAQNYNFTSNGSHIGIVYNTSTIDVGNEFPSRATVAQNYTLLKDDLETALLLYSTTSFLQIGPDYSYFNTINTKALYARIALQMNDWQTAANQADDVIMQSGLTLTPQGSYLNQWLQTVPLDEVLMQFTAPVGTDGQTGSSVSEYYLYISPINYKSYSASRDLLNLYEVNDIRNQLYEVQTIPTLINGDLLDRDYYFLKKYQFDSGTINLRLSEMHLIYAEAQERLTPGNTLALERLNDVRERAGLARLTAPSDMLEEVFIERRRELAFENSLFFDIARYKKDIVRDLGCIAQTCNLSYPSNFYILPIPQTSILNNENMIQNEGY